MFLACKLNNVVQGYYVLYKKFASYVFLFIIVILPCKYFAYASSN